MQFNSKDNKPERGVKMRKSEMWLRTKLSYLSKNICLHIYKCTFLHLNTWYKQKYECYIDEICHYNENCSNYDSVSWSYKKLCNTLALMADMLMVCRIFQYKSYENFSPM